MRVRKILTRVIIVLVPLLALSATVYGQGFGAIAGKITDPTGAVIAGAKVTATHADTNVRTAVASDATGEYRVLQITPGRYSLEADAPGFKTLRREGIVVQVQDRLTIDLMLSLGENRDVVEITADAPLLRTQDAQTGEVVTSTFLQNLPQLQRDPLQLLVIAGNVQGDGTRAGGGRTGDQGSDTRINGGRTSGVEYLVDGITAGTGVGHSVVSITPKLDAVAEFKVITNGISAEYGRMSGGAVELVTKGGGNQLHGQLFEYIQNDKLNANAWKQNWLGGERTPFRNNDFGVAVGGPVFIPKVYDGRNRTFFFANYEGIRFTQSGNLNITSVPTELERRGDFTQTYFQGASTMLYEPDAPASTFRTVTNPDGTTSQERTVLLEDGKHVPASRISPLATALLKLVPLPTPGAGMAGTSSANNYIAPQDTTRSDNAFAVRLDHSFNDNQRIFGRFTHDGYNEGATPWRGVLSAGTGTKRPGAWGATLNYSWTMSPTLILNARVSGVFNPTTQGNFLGDGFSNADLPFDAVTKNILGAHNIPHISNYAGDMNTTISDSAGLNVANSTTYNTALSMTKILANHTLKFGYEHRRYYDNFISDGKGWENGGYWLSNANPVNHQIGDGPYDNQARTNAFGPFLLGRLGTAWVNGPTNRAENFNYHAAYVQDDFKITNKLTLNLGLRWDMETPVTERYDRFYFWDPNAPPPFAIKPGWNWNTALQDAGLNPSLVPTPSWAGGSFPKGAIRIPNTPEFSSRKPFGYHAKQFAPRLGFAYQLDSKTVIRGSFAQMFMSGRANPDSSSTDADIVLGDKADSGWHPGGFAHYTSNFDNPYGGNVNHYTRSTELANYQVSGYNTVVSGFTADSHMPYELTQSLGIQRELPKGFLVQVEYSANQGHGLLAPYNVSQFPASLFKPENADTYATKIATPFEAARNTDPVALSKLMTTYPYYGPVRVLGANRGRSNYQSVNLRGERRLWQGTTFLANYTYSKLLDNVGGPELNADNSVNGGRGAKTFQSVDQIDNVYGYSPLDERHRLALTYSVELPVGRGKHFLGRPTGIGQAVLDGAIGGWQFSGTTIHRSGRPVVFGFNNSDVNNPYGIEATFGSYATTNTDLGNSAFRGNGSTLLSDNDIRIPGQARFDVAGFRQPATFSYGTLPPVYANIRHPGNTNLDLSLMKKFPFTMEGNRYLQLRLEALNALNIRGLGPYNTTVGDANFGFITTAGNVERRAQVSARIIF